jgi:Concanavalin A-like lectin/glucanases superfamily
MYMNHFIKQTTKQSIMKTRNVKVLLSAAIVLLMAWALASCSKKDSPTPILKTSLSAEITLAGALLTTTSEGTAAGNYTKGSQATLQASITAAQAIEASPTATQADVNAAVVSLSAAVAAYQAQIIVAIDPDNLVAQWTFDELTTAAVGTTVKDQSGHGHDGTMKAGHVFNGAGIPTLAADRYGVANKALHFDKGSNVEIPYSTTLNPTKMSVSLWAKADVNSPIHNNNYMIALNRWNGYKLNFQDSPKAFFTARVVKSTGDSVIYDHDDADALVTQGQWWHIVVTFGDGHMIFYLNGVMVKDWGAVPADLVPGNIVSVAAKNVNLVFGQDLPTGKYVTAPSTSPYFVEYGGFYIGAMDEVRIYKSVLSATQVTSIYTVEKP